MKILIFAVLLASAVALSPDVVKQLVATRERAFTYATMCTFDGPVPYSPTNHSEFFWATYGGGQGVCLDGDSTLWNGLLCLSGNDFACEAIFRMQGSDGRVWRSPSRVNKDKDNTFSRDMGEGAIAASLKTKNVTFMNMWRSYIVKQGGLCPEIKCMIDPSFFCIFNFVAEKLGLEALPKDVVAGKISDSFCHNGEWDILEGFMAITDELGYPLHLLVTRLLTAHMGGYWSADFQEAAKILHQRQPLNALFDYAENGASDDLANKVISLLPSTKPEKRNDWCWQRTDSEAAWLVTCGYDFVYMIDLLLLNT